MSLPSGGGGGSGGGKRKRDSGNSSSSGGGNNNKNNNNKQKSAANNIDTSKTTLSSLLKYMEGYEIIVELKTGIRHRGRLTSADDNMNLTLEEEEDDDQEQEEHKNNNEKKECNDKQTTDDDTPNSNNSAVLVVLNIELNIRGSNIRYIHFPDNANLSSVFQSGREREKNASRKYQKTKRKSS
jgi:small nuclear ribonucleoprotein (snRNP)-like protein